MKEIEFEIELDKKGLERLRVKLKTEKGELVDVLYQYESFIENKWREIVKI